jgi:hypothetical protein
MAAAAAPPPPQRSFGALLRVLLMALGVAFIVEKLVGNDAGACRRACPRTHTRARGASEDARPRNAPFAALRLNLNRAGAAATAAGAGACAARAGARRRELKRQSTPRINRLGGTACGSNPCPVVPIKNKK